ncbi:MAG: ATP-binding protein, partial [Thermodesulfobacteriota bacterium]
MEQVATLAKEIGFSDDRIEDLKTAVSEACLNAIEHGNEM